MVEAKYWKALPGGQVECCLCPHRCRIGEGRTGLCAVRRNQRGKLYSLVYGRPAAVNVDPIEKKPLFHFLPGSHSLSLGTVGCNLNCTFCQNCTLSRGEGRSSEGTDLPPEEAVRIALERGCESLSFTYNEPTVFAEYAQATAQLGREAGLRSVFVTNGYITQEALPEVYAKVDAANVDLKAFTDDFYRTQTKSSLPPVLETLTELRRRRIWIEVTNLLIPGLNDAEAEVRALCEWVAGHLGDRVPLHFTAFHPDHLMRDRPSTPRHTLVRARRLAREVGLKYVYLGNVREDDGSSTCCPDCGELLVARSWHALRGIWFEAGRCAHCGADADFVLASP